MGGATVHVLDAALVGVLIVSAATDIRTGRIYNLVTYPAIVLGLAAAAAGFGPPLWSAVAGCLVGGLSLYVLFAMRWMGGGDVKLMAAVGAFTGFPFILNAMFYSIFVGGVCAALILIWRGESDAVLGDLSIAFRKATGSNGLSLQSIPARGGSSPFGVAIALGTIIALAIEWRG